MRVAASIAVTVLATSVLAGCQFVTPQQTSRSYTPSDGVNGAVGDIEIRNVFLVDGEDDTASLIGVLSNTSSSASSVTLEWTSNEGTETKRLSVPANGLLSISTDASKPDTSVPDGGTSVILDDVDAKPGALFRISFTASSSSKDLQLPVLTGSQSQYATLVPTPTPTPTKTRRASPEASDSTSPSPTESLEG